MFFSCVSSENWFIFTRLSLLNDVCSKHAPIVLPVFFDLQTGGLKPRLHFFTETTRRRVVSGRPQSVSVVKYLNMLNILTRRLVDLVLILPDTPDAYLYQSFPFRIGSCPSDVSLGSCNCPYKWLTHLTPHLIHSPPHTLPTSYTPRLIRSPSHTLPTSYAPRLYIPCLIYSPPHTLPASYTPHLIHCRVPLFPPGSRRDELVCVGLVWTLQLTNSMVSVGL